MCPSRIVYITFILLQKAFNLPTKTPSERRLETENKQKQKTGLKKRGSKVTLPSILTAVKPAMAMKRERSIVTTNNHLSTNQLSVPVHSLNSMVGFLFVRLHVCLAVYVNLVYYSISVYFYVFIW